MQLSSSATEEEVLHPSPTWPGARGRAQAMASAKIGICAGLAFIVGPIGAGILIRKGGPGLAYKASALASVAQLLVIATQYRDTLHLAERRPGTVCTNSDADGAGNTTTTAKKNLRLPAGYRVRLPLQ